MNRLSPKSVLYIQSTQTNEKVEHVCIEQEDYNDEYERQRLTIDRVDAQRLVAFLKQKFNLE